MNHNTWMTHAQRLRDRRQPFALVTVLKALPPTSAKAGDKAVVTAEGQIHGWVGGGCAQPAVIKTVRRALRDGQPRHIRITPKDEGGEVNLGDVLEFGMSCQSGGTLELFVEPMLPPARLLVMGDSPVAHALVGLAPRVGFEVTLAAFGLRAEDHPDATQVLSNDLPDAVTAAWGQGGLVVVATQGRRDVYALQSALAVRPDHCWLVASARKAGVLKQQLIASGADAEAVNAIVSPAGEHIGAHTAEEIALSVLASVVAARRGRAPATSATHPSTVEA